MKIPVDGRHLPRKKALCLLLTRREAGKLLAVVAGSVLVPKLAPGTSPINSTVRGVQIGAQGYSFRDLTLDQCIGAYRAVGWGSASVSSGRKR